MQILGGHWIALQSVAWVGMIASYAHGETLGVAIEKTFDGDHPCGLCKLVKDGRDQEQQKQPVAKVLLKPDAVIAVVLELPMPEGADWQYSVTVSTGARRSLAPPTPPPRAA